jgi:Raf kinase inhibitor-like YbhB/YbcL family protein
MQKGMTWLISLLLVHVMAFGQTFTLTSDDIGGHATQKQVFNGFGCEGDNISPHLAWKNPPSGTKSFAVTIHDKDAPTGSGWWHWLIFNIPADVQELPTDAGNTDKDLAPEGAVQSVTDFGQPGYGGPCPPKGHGLHQYKITVYALDTEEIDAGKDTHPALVGFKLNQHTLSKASLIMYYGRE